MKLINNYKIDKMKKEYLDRHNYTFRFTKTANYKYDGSKIHHLAGRIWNKLDYFKYFKNLTKQLSMSEGNRTLIASIFEGVIIKKLKEAIYRFKEIAKFNPWFHKDRIEDLIIANESLFDFRDKKITFDDIKYQAILVYEAFMETAYKELKKIKLIISEYKAYL